MKALSAGLKRCARSMKSLVSSWLEISLRASAQDSSVRLALIIVRRATRVQAMGQGGGAAYPRSPFALSFDYLGYQVKARFHLRRDGLKQVVLVALRHLVLAQAQRHVLTVGHGFDAARVYRLQF